MTVDTSAVRSRRAILMGALGAAAATVGSALGRPEPVRAGVDGDVVLGNGNVATATTYIVNDTNTEPVFRAQSEDGVALLAITETETAIVGTSDSSTGIRAESSSGTALVASSASQTEPGAQGSSFATGVRGFSTTDAPTSDFTAESHHTGVIGVAGGLEDLLPGNTDETGVFGQADLSESSTGVWGASGQGFGVFGSGEVGAAGVGFIGVQGIPGGAGSTGVLAWAGTGEAGIYGYAGTAAPPPPIQNVGVQARAGSTSQVALNVNGRVQFSRSGRATIGAGQKSKVVTMAGVTTNSYIIATPQTNRSGIFVQSVVPAAGKFTINLNKTVPGTTLVGYLVIN
jgi:hypothetical protein